MAAQKGRELLIKAGDGASPTESFTTVVGARSGRLSFDGGSVDITTIGSTGRWRELLPGAGVKTLSVTFDGIFDDAAAGGPVLEAAARADTFTNFQVVVPGYGTYEGAFQVTGFEIGGEYNGEVTMSATLESSGEITFTAE